MYNGEGLKQFEAQLVHQLFQLLYSVLQSPFLGRLVVKFALGVLLFPVVKQTDTDIVSMAEVDRLAFTAQEFLNNLPL
jgi:hypothetical protein